MLGQQLWSAAGHGEDGEVRRLLSTEGAQSFINYQGAHGKTPLHLAAGFGHEAVMEKLLAVRCNVDLQMWGGLTPLHFAITQGLAAVTNKLIAARCDVNLQMMDGATALHLAAHLGHAAVATQLLAARSNVHLQADNGRTALQFAEDKGHTEIATLIRNKKQETPLLGRRVVINGLVAKPELNGRTGTAVSFGTLFYSVELDDSSSSLMIKPCNLLPVCSVAL